MIHLFEILAQSGLLQFSTICTQSNINTVYKYQYLDIQNYLIREILNLELIKEYNNV